jgi:hypothetical protein
MIVVRIHSSFAAEHSTAGDRRFDRLDPGVIAPIERPLQSQ